MPKQNKKMKGEREREKNNKKTNVSRHMTWCAFGVGRVIL